MTIALCSIELPDAQVNDAIQDDSSNRDDDIITISSTKNKAPIIGALFFHYHYFHQKPFGFGNLFSI